MTKLVLAPFLFLLACSSSSSSDSTPAAKVPCNEDPWQCPAGQTCWPKDTTGDFTCLNSATGKAKGDECTNIVGAPTCGDGLACFQGVGDATGKCVAYCAPAKAGRGCAAGETCSTAMLNGSTSKFQICVGASTPKDAGAETSPMDTGAGDSAASDAAAD